MEIKIYEDNSKRLDEAFSDLIEFLNDLAKKHLLNYYELFGLLDCYKLEADFQERMKDG